MLNSTGECDLGWMSAASENIVTREEKRVYNEWYRATYPEKQRGYDAKRDYSKKKPSPRDPIKDKSKELLYGAIQSGRIIRPNRCTDCAMEGPVQGHHEDYSKPLDVIWLCRPCHSKLHRKYA